MLRQSDGSLDRWRLLAIGGIAAYVIVGLLTLERFPLVWMDEPWYTQPAWSFSTNGTFGEPMFTGLYGLGTSNVAYGRIYLMLDAVVFRLFGLGPYQARLLSFGAGLAVIGLVYLLGARFWNRNAGGVAALLVAVAPPFVLQTHDARPEILLLGVALCGFYLVIESEQRRSALILAFAGLVGSLAADIHLNGILVPIALAAVLIVRRGTRVFATRNGIAFLGGTLVGLIWWVAVHVLPDPGLFASQWIGVWGSPRPPYQGSLDPVGWIEAEVGRYVAAASATPLAFLLPALAVVALVASLLRKPDSAIKTVGVYLATTVLLMSVVVANKTTAYAVLVWPLLALLVARFIQTIPFGKLADSLIAVVVVASAAAIAVSATQSWGADYGTYTRQIHDALPAGAAIQGEPTIWFGIADHPFVADHYFKSEKPYACAIARRGIEYVVADEFFLVDQLRIERSIDEHEVEAFLASHGTLVATIRDPYYGAGSASPPGPRSTKIYRINLPNTSPELAWC